MLLFDGIVVSIVIECVDFFFVLRLIDDFYDQILRVQQIVERFGNISFILILQSERLNNVSFIFSYGSSIQLRKFIVLRSVFVKDIGWVLQVN